MPSMWKSVAYFAVPVVFSGPSIRGVGRPIIPAGVVLIRASLALCLVDSGLQQILDANRQVAHAHSSRVINSVCNRRRNTCHPDLADPARTILIHDVVGIVEEDNLLFRQIRTSRN